jgi:hypothetical protein
VYMVPHATDKTRAVASAATAGSTIFAPRPWYRRPETCRIEQLTGKLPASAGAWWQTLPDQKGRASSGNMG